MTGSRSAVPRGARGGAGCFRTFEDEEDHDLSGAGPSRDRPFHHTHTRSSGGRPKTPQDSSIPPGDMTRQRGAGPCPAPRFPFAEPARNSA